MIRVIIKRKKCKICKLVCMLISLPKKKSMLINVNKDTFVLIMLFCP